MACTSKYEPWSREWIEVLHKGRELVDGRPRKTYREIAEELGTTRLRVEKAARRYGVARSGQYGTPHFSDSEKQEILKIIEDGVTLRLMCAAELRRALLAKGYKVSKSTIRRYVREDITVFRQYKANVLRKRRYSAQLATMRRLAKMASRKDTGETQVERKSHGRMTADVR